MTHIRNACIGLAGIVLAAAFLILSVTLGAHP